MLKFLTLILFLLFITLARADTLLLKNGRTIEGLIKNEDEKSLELEVSGGFVKFSKNEIFFIERSSAQEASLMRQEWQRQSRETDERIKKQQLEEERRPRSVEFESASQNIILAVTLNNKVEASLILDTGASTIMLSRNIATKLGLDLEKLKPDTQVQVADGRKAGAKHIVLESVKTQGVEAKNVDAVILLDELGKGNFRDGLLGMSFLNRFNFKVDHKEKKLILEKL